MIYPFLSERLKVEKVEKLVTNLYDKNEFVIHVRSLKQALNHGLILEKVNKIIEFNQKDWLKTCIVMNTELRQKAKNNFENDFFQVNEEHSFWKN